jgi:transposase
LEACTKKRVEYLEEIKDISLENMVYIDETGIEIAAVKDRGWGLKGKPLLAKKSGKYYERTNIISGLCGSKSVAPFVFNGNCNTALFENWVAEFLIKELEYGQVVIMDNATFHKSQRTRDLIESVGCRIIFLPPYSPDLNPIETFWANMKRWIRSKVSDIQSVQTTIDMFFSLC